LIPVSWRVLVQPLLAHLLALQLALPTLLHVLWCMVEEVVDLVSPIALIVDQSDLGQDLRKFAAFAGPLGRQLEVGGVAEVRVATLVGAIPHTFEMAAGVGDRQVQLVAQAPEFRMVMQAWSRHVTPPGYRRQGDGGGGPRRPGSAQGRPVLR